MVGLYMSLNFNSLCMTLGIHARNLSEGLTKRLLAQWVFEQKGRFSCSQSAKQVGTADKPIELS